MSACEGRRDRCFEKFEVRTVPNVYIDLEGVRKMDKLDGMLQDENGTKDPAVVVMPPRPPPYESLVGPSCPRQSSVVTLSSTISHPTRTPVQQRCKYWNKYLYHAVVCSPAAIIGLSIAMISIGAYKMGKCVNGVPTWMIALGVIQLVFSVYVAVHSYKGGCYHGTEEIAMPNLDSLVNRFCLILCYGTIILFVLFHWIFFSSWLKLPTSCSDIVLPFGLVVIIMDYMLFMCLCCLYWRPIKYMIAHPALLLMLIVFGAFLFLTLPLGLVFCVYLDRLYNSED